MVNAGNEWCLHLPLCEICLLGSFIAPCVIQLLTPRCHFLINYGSHLTAGVFLIQRAFLFPENAFFLKVFGSRRLLMTKNIQVDVYDATLTHEQLEKFVHVLQASLAKKAHLVFWKEFVV